MYQRIILALIRTKPERRKINFIFNPEGGSGKSLTADYITLNLQLASSERWVAAFIDQVEQYLSLNKVYPTTIIIDMTRNENNLNVESLYSTIENIKNGRVDSTFYGRFKRLRFKPPHVIVFTNNVPNMSALSSDRFNLFALANKDHNYTIVKCAVSVKIDTYSKSLVTWYYKARVCWDEDQQKFYEKILDADTTKIAMSALVNEDGHINKKDFDGDRRTKTHTSAPEPVQELLNKLLSENY